MGRETGVLMADGDPVGGEWNYDEENREMPPDSWDAPPVPDPDHDDLTRETAEWVAETFDTWGSTEGFVWPVTHSQARDHLRHFVTERLPHFGPYQDAIPELATANQLDAPHSLPEFYWSGETDMNCLSETVADVRARGYSHISSA
jgi:deoxyribodipyrimidine photolyase-like uncharacterized protein